MQNKPSHVKLKGVNGFISKFWFLLFLFHIPIRWLAGEIEADERLQTWSQQETRGISSLLNRISHLLTSLHPVVGDIAWFAGTWFSGLVSSAVCRRSTVRSFGRHRASMGSDSLFLVMLMGCVVCAAFLRCCINFFANITDALVILGTSVALLVKVVLLDEDATFALAKTCCVFGFQASQLL